MVYSQPYFKRLYRFLKLREYLLSVDQSGYYPVSQIKQAAIAIGINYNTLRADISFFQANSLIFKHGRNLRLKTLSASIRRFARFLPTSKSATEFCNLIKKSIFFSGLYKQAFIESRKIHDPQIRRKYLRTVRDNNTYLGVNQGLFCSLGNISGYFEKSVSTVKRYIQDLKKSRLLSVKNNLRVVGTVEQLSFFRKSFLVNRIEVVDNLVFERLTNSYKF